MTQTGPNPRFQTCVVSGPAGEATAEIVHMLAAQGVTAVSAAAIAPGTSLNNEIIRAIAAADFVVVLLMDRGSHNAIFELGLARGMNKPALVFTLGVAPPSDLQGMIYRSLPSLDRIGEVAADIARFLRNAKPPPSLDVEPPTAPTIDLGWAREELHALRRSDDPQRFVRFERLVGRILEAAGADVRAAGQSRDDPGVDFVVWLNDVAYALGGPILVECKYLLGGSGSVIKNAEAYAKRLRTTLAHSDASLALLVFDHSRPATPSTLFATPDVIVIAAEQIIDGLEQGTFEQDIIRRRRRAVLIGGGDV